MRYKKIISAVLLFGVVVVSLSFSNQQSPKPKPAKKRPNGCGVQLESKAGEVKSHFFGITCSNCHAAKVEKAPGCFTVSGSVYDEARARIHKNPVIQLFTEPGGKGDLVGTIYGDKNGNFYSTKAIDWSEGLYPTLLGTSTAAEPIKHMYRRVFTGDCNRCHGATAEALGID
ncbi:MAG: hypothetical protein RLY16_117 [Bacteroidota bacterium]|jgi:cytochrome c5